MDSTTVRANIAQIAADFDTERSARLQRSQLVKADFERLAQAGYLLTGLPHQYGGLWQGLSDSTRLYCDLIRTIAGSDPSLALVATMHPSVIGFWLDRESVAEPYNHAWQAQREQIFAAVRDGHWFGTVSSEPGSGGDLLQTRASARKNASGDDYLITGDKHMGSGSGITSFMITTAVVEGETEPELFLFDVREVAWDGSTGMQLTREWDAYGMAATQSHAFRFNEMPALRCAWPGHALELAPTALMLAGSLFTAVIVGIVDAALVKARKLLTPRRERMKAFEQVEWTRVNNEYWLIQQAFEGMLRAIEADTDAAAAVNRAKIVIAELAESLLQRLSHVLGGISLARSAPFGQWLQDIRALGFLRPPWPLAYERLFDAAWD